MTALEYLESHKAPGAELLRALLDDHNRLIYLKANPQQGGTQYLDASHMLNWNLDLALKYNDKDGKAQYESPATQLLHEGVHAFIHTIDPNLKDVFGEPAADPYLNSSTDLDLNSDLRHTYDAEYGRLSEQHVILNYEYPAAQQLGEVTGGPRPDHTSGEFISVPNVTKNGRPKEGNKKR